MFPLQYSPAVCPLCCLYRWMDGWNAYSYMYWILGQSHEFGGIAKMAPYKTIKMRKRCFKKGWDRNATRWTSLWSFPAFLISTWTDLHAMFTPGLPLIFQGRGGRFRRCLNLDTPLTRRLCRWLKRGSPGVAATLHVRVSSTFHQRSSLLPPGTCLSDHLLTVEEEEEEAY